MSMTQANKLAEPKDKPWNCLVSPTKREKHYLKVLSDTKDRLVIRAHILLSSDYMWKNTMKPFVYPELDVISWNAPSDVILWLTNSIVGNLNTRFLKKQSTSLVSSNKLTK